MAAGDVVEKFRCFLLLFFAVAHHHHYYRTSLRVITVRASRIHTEQAHTHTHKRDSKRKTGKRSTGCMWRDQCVSLVTRHPGTCCLLPPSVSLSFPVTVTGAQAATCFPVLRPTFSPQRLPSWQRVRRKDLSASVVSARRPASERRRDCRHT